MTKKPPLEQADNNQVSQNITLVSSGGHIACADYDYIEIMCLYRYRVNITMKDLRQFQGQLFNTRLMEVQGIKHEAIIGIDIHQLPLALLLSEIMTIDILDEEAKFNRLTLE
jgi:Rho-binding antiterminator